MSRWKAFLSALTSAVSLFHFFSSSSYSSFAVSYCSLTCRYSSWIMDSSGMELTFCLHTGQSSPTCSECRMFTAHFSTVLLCLLSNSSLASILVLAVVIAGSISSAFLDLSSSSARVLSSWKPLSLKAFLTLSRLLSMVLAWSMRETRPDVSCCFL